MASTSATDRTLLALLLGLLFASLWLNLGSVPLFDVDEGAFSEATREMLARGDYLSTWMYGEPRHDKPILIYWLQAASVALFGLGEFALRLPSALAGTLWVLVVYAFAARIRDHRTGLLAASFTAGSLLVSVIGRAATADALLNLFIATAMLSIGLWHLERRARYLYLTFAAMGFGFLAKGPIAVVIPFAVSALFFLGRGEWRAWLGAIFHPGGIALFLVIALPWYIAQYLSMGPAFLEGFLLEHNVSRFQEPMHGHAGHLLYYLPVVLFGVLPFTSVLLRTLAELRHGWRDPVQRYLLLWFGFVFLFFTASGTKLPHYILYGMTGLFVLMALHADAVRSRWLLLTPPLLFFSVLLLLPELLQLAAPGADAHTRAVLGDPTQHFGPGWRPFFMAAIVATLAAAWYRPLPKMHALSGVAILCALALSLQLMPTLGRIMQQPVVNAAAVAAQHDDVTITVWRTHNPSFSVYLNRLTPQRRPEVGELAFTRTTGLERQDGSYRILFEERGYALVQRLQ